MIVDAHTHLWQPAPHRAGPVRTIVSSESVISADLLRHYLDEHRVQRAVLVQPIYPGEDNSYVADAAAAEPECFAAVCVVDPRTPEAAKRLAYWCAERGCRGVRLRPKVPGEAQSFGHPSTDPLWEEAARLQIVVSVLCDFAHLPAVARMAERFPTIPIVIDHLAHPSRPADLASLGPLLELKRFPRVFVKVSGLYYFSQATYPYADCRELLRAVYEDFGPARMIWGSDFPHVLLKASYSGALSIVERLCPWIPAGERERILGENAVALYWPTARTLRASR